MFTKGLENNAYKVRNASENLATKIADALGKVQNYVRNTVSIIENKYELWKIKNDIVADSSEDLSKQLEVQREKHNLLNIEIEATEQALNKAIEKFGEGSSVALEYRNRLLELQVAQAELGEEIENTTSKLNEQKKYFGDKISDSVYRTSGGGSDDDDSESYYNSDTGEHHIFDEDGTHTIIDDDGNMRTVDDSDEDEEPGGWIGNGYATGTDYAKAGLALVGEEGPELVNFKGGEKVYTAEETQSLLGRIINNFNISSLVVREEADIKRIARELYMLQNSATRGAGVS
jgi:phage-related tail protein